MPRRHSMIVEATSAMPFAGKNIIRKIFLEGRDAANNGQIEIRDDRAQTLSLDSRRHAVIGGIGAAVCAVHAYFATRHGFSSEINTIQAVYDGLFSVANGATAFTQLHLSKRLMEMEVTDAASSEAAISTLPPNIYNSDPTSAQLAVTLIGFSAFAATLTYAAAETVADVMTIL